MAGLSRTVGENMAGFSTTAGAKGWPKLLIPLMGAQRISKNGL